MLLLVSTFISHAFASYYNHVSLVLTSSLLLEEYQVRSHDTKPTRQTIATQQQISHGSVSQFSLSYEMGSTSVTRSGKADHQDLSRLTRNHTPKKSTGKVVRRYPNWDTSSSSSVHFLRRQGGMSRFSTPFICRSVPSFLFMYD